MKAAFADSFYFFALVNPRDSAHARALAFSEAFDGCLVTTAWGLTEVGDGLAAPRDRPTFIRLVSRLQTDPLCRIVAPSAELFRSGIELFGARADKAWSLTDCLSFIVMQREGIVDALTADQHFAQAGFQALLSKPA